ncbi:putative RNA-directed DNA polymerase from transposon BS [Trichonephila clavipes]|nr:putative RNA-directed DNA polymerase from transposon BS [Trichonephila clavipes]
MAGPLPRFVPCRARVGSAKTADAILSHIVHDLELAVQDLLSQGVPQGSVLSPLLFPYTLRALRKSSLEGIFAEQHKLIFNVSKSTSSFFTTNRRLYNYQPQIFMESKSLPYEKHPKYLGYILDPEILSNKHIDYVINKGRKRLDLLKYIAERDWGADAGTLRLTYTSLIRPVLESELIAIDEALRIIKTMTSPDEIWILCDSRSAIQHLSDWTNVGDKTSVSILKNLKELSQQHEIYFQWIPSHIGLFGNDTADLLAKEGVTEDLMSRRTLTFSEIFSKTKSLIQELWKTPPTHPWYNRQAPGGALSIKADRVVQTTISRLASGHIRGLSFHLGQKIYENCTKCNLVQATPDHLLFCAGPDREDIYSSPLLVYEFPEDSWAHGISQQQQNIFHVKRVGGSLRSDIAFGPFQKLLHQLFQDVRSKQCLADIIANPPIDVRIKLNFSNQKPYYRTLFRSGFLVWHGFTFD